MVGQDLGRTTEALGVPDFGCEIAKVGLELGRAGEIEQPVIVRKRAGPGLGKPLLVVDHERHYPG